MKQLVGPLYWPGGTTLLGGSLRSLIVAIVKQMAYCIVVNLLTVNTLATLVVRTIDGSKATFYSDVNNILLMLVPK